MLRWLHPAVVHFSVAFLVGGGVAGVLGYLAGKDPWIRFAHRLLVLGCLCLLPTLVTGYLAANSVVVGPDAVPVLDGHEQAGWMVSAFAGVTLFWLGWHRGRIPQAQRGLFAAWLLALIVVVFYAGWMGGKLVYIHQVGTGP